MIGMNSAPRFWALEFEGLEILDETDLQAFFDANSECMTPDEMATIRHLEPGVTFADGGGSAPEWSIRRMTADECADGGF